MKRKLVISLGAFVAIVGAAIVFVSAQNTKIQPSLLGQNIEALAAAESGGTQAHAGCPIWDVTITTESSLTGPKVTVTCSTGGTFKCNESSCPN